MATYLATSVAAAAEPLTLRIDPWSYLHHAGAHVHPVATRPAARTAMMPAEEATARMSSEVKQSIGCLVTGTAATAAAIAAGAENLVNVAAGGLVSSANPVVLYMSVAAVIFASFCAIGQALTPLYIYYVEPADEPLPPARVPADDCLTCKQARQPHPLRHASGPAMGDVHNAAFIQTERVRTVAAPASQPATTVSAVMATLAGSLGIRK